MNTLLKKLGLVTPSGNFLQFEPVYRTKEFVISDKFNFIINKKDWREPVVVSSDLEMLEVYKATVQDRISKVSKGVVWVEETVWLDDESCSTEEDDPDVCRKKVYYFLQDLSGAYSLAVGLIVTDLFLDNEEITLKTYLGNTTLSEEEVNSVQDFYTSTERIKANYLRILQAELEFINSKGI